MPLVALRLDLLAQADRLAVAHGMSLDCCWHGYAWTGQRFTLLLGIGFPESNNCRPSFPLCRRSVPGRTRSDAGRSTQPCKRHACLCQTLLSRVKDYCFVSNSIVRSQEFEHRLSFLSLAGFSDQWKTIKTMPAAHTNVTVNSASFVPILISDPSPG